MLTYLYLDYGGHAKYRQELKYSLISLKAELGEADAQIAVYSDAPGSLSPLAGDGGGDRGADRRSGPAAGFTITASSRKWCAKRWPALPGRCAFWIRTPSCGPAFMPR